MSVIPSPPCCPSLEVHELLWGPQILCHPETSVVNSRAGFHGHFCKAITLKLVNKLSVVNSCLWSWQSLPWKTLAALNTLGTWWALDR